VYLIYLIPGAWPRDSLRSSLEVFSQEVLKVLDLVLLVVVVFLCMIKLIKTPQALVQELEVLGIGGMYGRSRFHNAHTSDTSCYNHPKCIPHCT
jgi:hypothetical protein